MGKVNKLTLDHFTAFAGPVEFNFSSGINVFIGANSTGKTHVMKAIYALLKTAASALNRNVSLTDLNLNTQGKIDNLAEDQLMGIFKPNQISDLIRREKGGKQASLSLLCDGKLMKVNIDTQNMVAVQFAGDSFPLPETVTFIPVHELLSIYPGFIAAYNTRETAFDQTYYDLAIALSAAPLRETYLSEVEPLITPFRNALSGASVSQEKNQFFIKMPEGKLEAHLVSEGYRKLATLLYLLNNGSLAPGGILLWDEPETNLNPQMVTNVVKALKVLCEAGIQIFISTHDYLLSQELSLAAEYSTEKNMRFFALYKPKRRGGVLFDEGDTLAEIKNNPILDEFAAHFDREVDYFQTGKE